MPRGRKRKFNPDIPKHIDQATIPAGFYFERGRWYVLDPNPITGRARKKTIANGRALLSDLHRLAEQRGGSPLRGTLRHAHNEFQKSARFRKLSKSTRDDYVYHGNLACDYKLKNGTLLGEREIDRIDPPAMQKLVDRIAEGWEATPDPVPPRPSTANHVLRYLRRLFGWSKRRGYCITNPGEGIEQAEERKQFKMPTRDVFALVHAFAVERGKLAPHSLGSVPPYMAPAMVIAHGCRLRGVEVHALTDAHELKEGILCDRAKGSLDNVTKWNDELRAAWDRLVEVRAKIWKRTKPPTILRPEHRYLVVNQSGHPLSRSGMKTTWQRLMDAAVAAKVITDDERFTMHGLKHRGITDTRGGRHAKNEGAGHKSLQQTDHYNHELIVVEAANPVGKKATTVSAVKHLRKG